jgi:RND superfamily putative drug exporter
MAVRNPGSSPSTRSVVTREGRLARLAHFTTRFRWPVIAGWIALTIFGGYAAGQLSTRWYQSLAVPGKPAYEASQRTLKTLGAGDRSPSTVVFHSSSVDVSKSPAVRQAAARVVKASPGALTSSYFSTGNAIYVSRTGTRPSFRSISPGPAGLDVKSDAGDSEPAAAGWAPRRISVDVRSGRAGRGEQQSTGGSERLLEALIGGLGALIILLSYSGRCRGGDAARRRARVDPEHVHARLGPAPTHRRLDHRPVPDRSWSASASRSTTRC